MADVSDVQIMVSDVELKSPLLTDKDEINGNGHDDVITCSNGEVGELKAASASHHQIVKVLGTGQANCENEEGERDKGPQQTLMDVGNTTEEKITVTLPRKSLLKKRKLSISDSTPANSRKRIRIVDNPDVANFSDESDSETLEGADDSATVTKVVSCGENLTWLNSSSTQIDQSNINVEFVRESLVPVKRSFSVEIDMRFILSGTVNAILATRTSIVTVGASEFDVWITQHSLFNDPKLKGISYKENFLKLANIDAVLGYDLTSPNELIKKTVDHQEENNIYFIGDIWQNSKGYREYLLWKTGQMEKDFSTKILTLRTTGPYAIESDIIGKIGLTFQTKTEPTDESDLGNISAENVESNGPSSEHVCILDLESIDSFTNFVLSRTGGKGLHTLVADNPEFSNAYESVREIRFQKYFYCECLLALRCLREGGRFVCKIFDTLSLFTNGLIFLLYKCFKSIAIHKPSSSSPCSSERFVICKGKIDNADTKYVIDYLIDSFDMVINKQEQRKIVRRRVRKRLQVVKMEVQKLVPLPIILSHAQFFEFIRESNIRLASSLAESIGELCNLMEQKDNTSLKNLATRLNKGQQAKLALWSLPNVNEFVNLERDAVKKIEAFVTRHDMPIETYVVNEVRPEGLQTLANVKELVAFPVQRYTKGTILKNTSGLFFCCGGSKIFFLRGSVWCPLDYSNFSLPSGTVVFGELAEELSGSGASRKFVPSLHLFDASFVRGTYIGSLPFKSRQAILTRLINSVKSDSCNINCHVVHALNLRQLTTFYASTKSINVLGYNGRTRYYSNEKGENCVLANGFLLFRCVETESPSEFIKKSEQHVLMWENNEEAVKCSLKEVEKCLD